MFASRNDNENAIYEQQTTAAGAKPLDLNKKAFAPKTPGKTILNTPFRRQNSKENNALGFGKSGAKASKVDFSAFVTPANTRARAPLGNKTTNGKALLQTPAPLQLHEKKTGTVNKGTSPRLRRSKIKVHEPTVEVADDVLLSDGSESEPEIEYMPPREEPLPDHDDDVIPHDRDYSFLGDPNVTRHWLNEYMPPRENNDHLTLDEQWAKVQAEREKAEEARKTKSKALGTMKAQHAAAALATKSAKLVVPSFASSTAAARARQPLTTTKAPRQTTGKRAGNPRFTAAKVASNNTIGYSKGRQVSAQGRVPLSDVHAKITKEAEVKDGDRQVTLAELLGLTSFLDDENDAEEQQLPPLFAPDTVDEEEEVYQIPLPE